MSSGFHHFAAVAILGAVLLTLASDQGTRAPGPPPPVPRAAASSAPIDRWPAEPRALAGLMTQRYGPPDEALDSQASWTGRGPWRRIVVFRDPDPAGRRDYLLQTVRYGAVPMDHHWRDLSDFDRGGVSYDPSAGELSARTSSQETNYLALNLADEVLRGRRTAQDARDFYDAASNLSAAGKSSPYIQGLLFGPPASQR